MFPWSTRRYLTTTPETVGVGGDVDFLPRAAGSLTESRASKLIRIIMGSPSRARRGGFKIDDFETRRKYSGGRKRLHDQSTRHGEYGDHFRSSAVAHSFVRSLWQPTQGFGILSLSVIPGVMKRNVWLRTFTFAISCSIRGMWQDTHSLPGLPSR